MLGLSNQLRFKACSTAPAAALWAISAATSPSSKPDALKTATLQSLSVNSISRLLRCASARMTTTAVATSRSSIKIADGQDGTSNSTASQQRRNALPSEPLAVPPSSKIATLQSSSHSYATGHPRDTTTSKQSLVPTTPSAELKGVAIGQDHNSESNASIVSAELKGVVIGQDNHVNLSLGGSSYVHQQESTAEAKNASWEYVYVDNGRVAKQLIFRRGAQGIDNLLCLRQRSRKSSTIGNNGLSRGTQVGQRTPALSVPRPPETVSQQYSTPALLTRLFTMVSGY
jgi:hypothetical protein